MSEQLPSIANELERKTLDQLERLMRFYEQGKISKAQFASSVDTMYQIVAGLIPEPVLLALESFDIKPDNSTFDTSRFFWKRQTGEAYAVRRHTQGECLSIAHMVPGKLVTKADMLFANSIVPSLAASLKQDKLAAALIDKGYQEV